jgi:hypothetical protein
MQIRHLSVSHGGRGGGRGWRRFLVPIPVPIVRTRDGLGTGGDVHLLDNLILALVVVAHGLGDTVGV